eukprot:8101167-Heterocapsa_arctica.AAC.1
MQEHPGRLCAVGGMVQSLLVRPSGEDTSGLLPEHYPLLGRRSTTKAERTQEHDPEQHGKCCHMP